MSITPQSPGLIPRAHGRLPVIGIACVLVWATGCQNRSHPPRFSPRALPTRAATGTLPEQEPYVRVISGEQFDPEKFRKADEARGKTPKPPPLLDRVKLEEIHIHDMTLGQATVMLTRMIGQNVVVSSSTRDTRVNVYLRNISARGAVEGLCRLNGLWYREDPEMIRILAREEYEGELVIKSDEQTRLYYLKNASALGVADMIASLMPDQVEYDRPGEEASFGHVGTDGDDPLSSSNGTGGGGAGKERTDGSGSSGYGGSAVSRSSHNYSLSDVTGNFQKGLAAGKIEQLARDALSRQKGEVSAQELAAKTGAQPPVTLSVFLRNNCIGVRAVQESIHEEIGKIIEALDTPTRQVLLEVKVLSVALGNGLETLFKASYRDGGQMPQVTAQWLDGSEVAGQTVSFGYLDKHISVTMQALESDNRLQVVATPMLLCASNAPGEFFSGVTRMITTNYDYETRYGEDNDAVDIARPVVEEREIGTKVNIKPSINADGTVTLRFRLEVGTVNEGGGSISQVKDGKLVQLPIDTVDSNKVESIVVANHGQAVVMGGLISDVSRKTSEHVPMIGRVPVLGTLFGKKQKKVERAETVVVIIPHIIGNAEHGERASTHLLKRTTTHPWSTHNRENLTRYDSTEELLERNRPKK